MGSEITSPGLLTVATDGSTITGDGTPGNPLVGASANLGANNVLTYRPDGTDTGPAVFNDWTALYAQLVALRTAAAGSGQFRVLFDDVFATTTVPTGTYDMARTTLGNTRGTRVTVPMTVFLDVGVVFNNLHVVEDLYLGALAGGSARIIHTDGTLTLNNASVVANLGTSCVQVTANAQIVMTGNAFLTGAVDAAAVLIDDAVTCDFHLYDGASWGANAVQNGGAGSFYNAYFWGSSSQVWRPQDLWTTTFSLSQNSGIGLFQGDPNGLLDCGGYLGSLVVDWVTGTVYQNTDGAMTWTAFGGGSSSQYAFVFQPGGGGTGPVFYDDFDVLYAAMNSSTGPHLLIFDDTFGALGVPALAYDFTEVTWRGRGGVVGSVATIPTVTIFNGAVLTGLRRVERLRIECDADDANPPITDMVDGDIFVLDDHAVLAGNFGVIGFDVVDVGKIVYIDVRNGSQVLQGGGSTGIILTRNGTSFDVYIHVDKTSLFESNTLGQGTGGTNAVFHITQEGNSASSGVPAVQSFYPGTTVVSSTGPSAYNVVFNQAPLVLYPSTVNHYTSGFATDINLQNASWLPGAWVIIKNSSTETRPLTVYPSGCDTIEGKSHYVVGGAAGASVRLVSDGISNWNIVSSHQAPGSYVFMEGETPGVGAGESVELTITPAPFYFELVDDTNYTLLVTAIAHGVSPGTTNQSFRQMFSVRKAGGTTVIAASGSLEQIGDAGGSTWTLVASVGAGPDRFALTFTNGTSNTYVRVRAKIEIVEVYVPPM